MYFTGSEAALSPELVGRLNDAHCHPTTATAEPGAVAALRSIGIGSLVAMSTTVDDQQHVEDLARSDPDRVVPAFGFHPWATHAITFDPTQSKADHYATVFLTPTSPATHLVLLDELVDYLPVPTPLEGLLVELESRLRRWPCAQLGEVGLDKKARMPFPAAFRDRVAAESTSDSLADSGSVLKEDKLSWLRSKALSPFVTSLDHQTAVLQAQVDILRRVVAVEGRPRCISLHAVGVSAPVAQLLTRWEREWQSLPAAIRVLLHSCSLSWEAWQIIERKSLTVYVSISPLLLSAPDPSTPMAPATVAPLFTRVRPDRILIESDHSDITQATDALWAVVRALAAGRTWPGDGADGNSEGWATLNEAEQIERVVDVVGANFATWVGKGRRR